MNQAKYNMIALMYLLLVLGCLAFVFATTGCAPGRTGDTGSVGPRGPQGVPGLPGLVGPVGPAGLDGKNGSDASIGVLNLCPGTTTYANVFVEVALCINGDLYGVYSSNGGFMTYLPPGQYSSDGIGAACNLTIGPNCTVAH